MIRLTKKHFLMLPAVDLYRDDLDHLIEIMQSACQSIEISDDDFKYESLDEMRNKVGANPRSIQLSAYGPYVVVSVRRFGIPALTIYAAEKPEAESVFLQVSDLVQKRKSMLSRVFDWRIWTGFLVGYLGLRATLSTGGNVTISVVTFASLVGALIVAVTVRLGSLSQISLTLRHETDTFWRRNGDKLMVGIVGAILGIILKSLWDWLIGRISAGTP